MNVVSELRANVLTARAFLTLLVGAVIGALLIVCEISMQLSLFGSAGADSSPRYRHAGVRHVRPLPAGEAVLVAKTLEDALRGVPLLGPNGPNVGQVDTGPAPRPHAPRRTMTVKNLATLRPLVALEREAARFKGEAGAVAGRMAQARGWIAELELQMLHRAVSRGSRRRGARGAGEREPGCPGTPTPGTPSPTQPDPARAGSRTAYESSRI